VVSNFYNDEAQNKNKEKENLLNYRKWDIGYLMISDNDEGGTSLYE